MVKNKKVNPKSTDLPSSKQETSKPVPVVSTPKPVAPKEIFYVAEGVKAVVIEGIKYLRGQKIPLKRDKIPPFLINHGQIVVKVKL